MVSHSTVCHHAGPPPAITSVMAGQGEATAYPSMRPRAKRSQPSIPSKFETTLHVGQRERNAFGTRTLRFTPGEHELPGPGNYHRNSSMVRTGASVSKLGAGVGFVSKVRQAAARLAAHRSARARLYTLLTRRPRCAADQAVHGQGGAHCGGDAGAGLLRGAVVGDGEEGFLAGAFREFCET